MNKKIEIAKITVVTKDPRDGHVIYAWLKSAEAGLLAEPPFDAKVGYIDIQVAGDADPTRVAEKVLGVPYKPKPTLWQLMTKPFRK